MIIEDQRTENKEDQLIRVDELGFGQIFELEDQFFMKLTVDHLVQIINLADNRRAWWIRMSTLVKPVKAKLVIYENGADR